MTGTIPQHFIDEVIARSDIVDLIGSRVQLKKAGKEFKACCPFHDEKTPSFTVSPHKQFYHCFGCGAHGTSVGFLMEHDHMSFVEAVEDLASSLGLEVPREKGAGTSQRGPDLFPIMEEAQEFFRQSLKNSAEAVAYLKTRGLTGEVAARFGIGYAPAAWGSLLEELGQDEHRRDQLTQAGVLVKKDAGGHYDRFRDRIMFPILDYKGRPIAFGGRIVGAGEPKYLNSPETPLFHKGRELYGLYEARQALRQLPRILVVEGYMDVVGLVQFGIHNAVATLGTATTGDHLRKLFRVTEEVLFCFDGDRAGRQAAWRALENALPHIREGRQIKFLFLPEGHDPDSLVREEGAEEFLRRCSDGMPLSDFLIGHLSDQVDLDSLDGRARLAELARPLVKRIPKGVYRQLLIDRLSETVQLPPQKLGPLVVGAEPEDTRSRRPAGRHMSTGRRTLVRQAISLLLHHPGIASEAQNLDELRTLRQPGVDLLVELLEVLKESPNITTAGVLERWRGQPSESHLHKLAACEVLVSAEEAGDELKAALARLIVEGGPETRAQFLLDKARSEVLSDAEKQELQGLLSTQPPQHSGPTEGKTRHE